MFQQKKSSIAGKDEEEGTSVDEEAIENNIKEVNIIRNKVITEKWIAPIDLSLTSVKDMRLHKLNWENMTDMPNKMKATNTGNTVIVSAKWNHTRPHIRGGSLLSTYVFSQLHFHWGSSEHEGSEHRVNGISYPLEMHAVFFKSLYLTQDVALTKEDGVVTVVYLFKLTSETNEVLNLITSKLADIQVPHSSIAIDPTPLSTLLYPFPEDYFMYWGKLQTTVCEHPVLWIISRHAFGVTQSQLKEFRNLLSSTDGNLVKNFRDPSPLNERPVFHVNPSSNLDMVLLPGIVKQDLQLVTVMYNYINECYNKYNAGSKNMNKNMYGDSTKGDYGKVVLPGSGKLTKYDYVYNTMQSSGIKILFLLREITNILHQRILQGETNYPQNSGQDVLCNKENIADTICVGHLNRDNDRRSKRMKSMRRNTEPSILMKPKLCKTRNINNLVRLKQSNSKHSAVYNKQNCLMKTKTFSSFNRPNINLIQNDVNNIPPVDLSNCKHLFSPQSNRRKADEKPVSKIQTETNRSSKLKQVKDKMSVAVQDGANYYNLPKKQTSKTRFSSSDCRFLPTVENKNKAISDETIFFKSLTKPYFKELDTIREESRILRQETPSSLNTALVNEAGNTTSVVDPFPLLSQFGLNETHDGDISQTVLLEKTTKQDDVQNRDIKINDDYKDPVNNENSIFGVKKFAALSKQIMNVFHLSILTDNESPVLCSLNPNSENEQKTHLEKANDHLLDVHDEQEMNQNYINAANSIKSDGITMKNRIPMSLNHQVMNLVEDTGIEINTQRMQPVKNDLKSFLPQSDNGDSQLTQNKYCISSNKKEPITNGSMVKQCDDCPFSHMLNQLDVNSIHGDTMNTQAVSLAEKTNIYQNNSGMVTNLKLICTDIQETHPKKSGRVGEANHQGGNSIQRSVNTIRKQLTDEQHSPQQECCSIRNKTTIILNENGANFTRGNMRKLLKETIVIDDTTAGNEVISGSSQVAHSAYAHEHSCSVKEDYSNLKTKNNNSNFTFFNEQKPHLYQNNFEIMNQINHEDLHVNQHENYETAGNTGNKQIMNSSEFSVEARQADVQQKFTNIIKKTNHSDFSDYGKHCNKGNEESCYKKNEHLYDNDDDHSDQKSMQQINEEISSLFGDIDNTSIYSETVMCKAIPLSFFEENLHVNTTTPVLMQETNTAILSKQVTSLYQNSNFEDAVTNPNSVTSSRIPSMLSVNNDKTLKNKVADQIANVQKHLYRAHNRSEKTKDPRNDRGGMVRSNTRTVHLNNPYNKNADNDVVKNNKLHPQTQNTKRCVSKIPKPIPVYTKVRKKLESKIPRPTTRAGTGNEIKSSTRPNNIFK